MASRNDYDGLHVQSIEHPGSPQFPESYKPQPPHDTKELASSVTSPHYQNAPRSSYFTSPGSNMPPSATLPSYSYSTSQPRRNPWGLSPLAFAAIIALITAIIVGGAVGGGLAAVNSSKSSCPASQGSTSAGSNSCNSGTSTSVVSGSGGSATVSASTAGATPTGVFRNFIPPSPEKVESLYNDCASLNASTMVSAQGTRFRLTCPQAILGTQGSNGITLSETVAYTLQDCINACSLMNFWKGSTVCNSITWDNGMAGATAANFGGNCWLFRDSTTFQVKANSTSARLQS